MIKISKQLSAGLLAALLMICFPLCVFAESAQKLIDDADLFSEEENSKLTSKLEELSKTTGWDVIIYTNYNDIDSDEMEYYYNSYYDEQGFGKGSKNSGIMLSIDMGSDRRLITTKGDAMYYFSDDRLDDMKADIVSKIDDEDYYSAAEVFINYISEFYADGKPEDGEFSSVEINEKYDNPALYVIKHYGVGIAVVSLAVALFVVFSVNRRYKNNGKKDTYDLNANSKTVLTNREDVFVDKRIVVTRIQRDIGPSGGGGESSHGGGGSF